MKLRLVWAAVLLVACDQEPRALSVVVEEEGAPDATPKPADTAEPEPTEALPEGQCGADLTEQEGDLPLVGCARLSPEPGDTPADTGVTDTGLGDTGLGEAALPPPGAPPPCGYYNLLGAVDMAGDPTAPDLLYCDADDDGGLRLAHWDIANGELSRTLLLEDTCWVDFMTGVLTREGDSTRAWWVQLASVDDTSVWTTRLDAEGGFAETPIPVEGSEGARRVVVLDADGTRLVLQGMDGSISVLDPSTRALSAVAEAAWTFGAGEAGPGIVVASCDEESLSLTVTALDTDGELAWRRAIDGASCGYLSNPAVTGDEERVVVSWDDGEEGGMVLLDGEGELIGAEPLGKSSTFPVASLLGASIWTVDGSGAVSRWSRDGELEASWLHRGVSGALGTVVGLRFEASEDGLVFTLIGQDSVTSESGHLNTFYYLETSASALPTP